MPWGQRRGKKPNHMVDPGDTRGAPGAEPSERMGFSRFEQLAREGGAISVNEKKPSRDVAEAWLGSKKEHKREGERFLEKTGRKRGK